MTNTVRGIIEDIELGKPFDDKFNEGKQKVNVKLKINGTKYIYKYMPLERVAHVKKGTMIGFSFNEKQKEYEGRPYTEREIDAKTVHLDNDHENHTSHPTTQVKSGSPSSSQPSHGNDDKRQAVITFLSCASTVKDMSSDLKDMIEKATHLADAAFAYKPSEPSNTRIIDDDIPF
jgi:hypothetical protein